MNDLSQFLLNHGGPVLFGMVLADQAGLPLPAAPWLLAAGALSAAGKLSPSLAIALTVLACLVADSVWFYVGRRGGRRVLRQFCRLSLSPNSCIGSTKGLIARHGEQGLVAAKFIPVLGGVMPPIAGALGMSTARFLAFDALGSILYGTFYVLAGFAFHNQLRQIGTILHAFGFSSLIVVLAAVASYIAFKYIRRRQSAINGSLLGKAVIRATAVTGEIVAARCGEAVESRLPIPDDSPGHLAIPNVALAFTNAAPQPVRDYTTSSVVQLTPV